MSVLRPFIVNPTGVKRTDAERLLDMVKNEDGTNGYYFKEPEKGKYKNAFVANDTNAKIGNKQIKNEVDLKELDAEQKKLFVEGIQRDQSTLYWKVWTPEYYQTFVYDGIEYLFEPDSNTISDKKRPFLFYGNIVGFRSDKGIWTRLNSPVSAMVIGPIVDPIKGILKKDVQFDPSPMMLTNDMLNSASTDSFKDVLFPPESEVATLTGLNETVDMPDSAQSVDTLSPETKTTPAIEDSDDDDSASGGQPGSKEDLDSVIEAYGLKTTEYIQRILNTHDSLGTRLLKHELALEEKENELMNLSNELVPEQSFEMLQMIKINFRNVANEISKLKTKEIQERKQRNEILKSKKKNDMENEIKRINDEYTLLAQTERRIMNDIKQMENDLNSIKLPSSRSSEASSSTGTISTQATTNKPIVLPSVPTTPLSTDTATGSTTISTPPTETRPDAEPDSTSETDGPTGHTSTPDSGPQSGAGSASSTVGTGGQTTTPPPPAQLNWVLAEANPFPILDSNALFKQGNNGTSNFFFFGIMIQARKVDSLHFALQQQFLRLRSNLERRRTYITGGYVVFFQYGSDGSVTLSPIGGPKVPISNVQYDALLARLPKTKGKHYQDEPLAGNLGGQEIVAMREANGGVRPMWFAKFSHY